MFIEIVSLESLSAYQVDLTLSFQAMLLNYGIALTKTVLRRLWW